MRKENNTYIMDCETTPEYARETYYEKKHVYKFEVPADQLPHELKVWLVDEMDQVTTLIADDCTVESVIEHLKKCRQDRDVYLQNFFDLAKNNPESMIQSDGKIAWVKNYVSFCDEGYSEHIPSIIRKKIEALLEPHFEVAVKNERERREQKALAKKLAAEKEERERKERAARIEKREHELRQKQDQLIADNCPEHLSRFRDGYIGHDELTRIITDVLIPDSNDFTSHIFVREFHDCKSDNWDFDWHVSSELSEDEYDVLTELRDEFPNYAVEADDFCFECSECGWKRNYRIIEVSTKVADTKYSRYFVVNDNLGGDE